MGQVDIEPLKSKYPIGEEFIALAERCPILLDEDFLREHPKLWGAIGFLHPASSNPGRSVYENLGVKTTEEYVGLIQQGNPEAIAHYQRISKILCL